MRSLKHSAKGVHLRLPIGPKNTNLIADLDILFPVKFHRNPFSGCKEEVKNVTANQARAAILVFRSTKNAYLVEVVQFLLPVKFEQTPLSGFREKVENVSANKRPGRQS